jgi:hypothetical protein
VVGPITNLNMLAKITVLYFKIRSPISQQIGL